MPLTTIFLQDDENEVIEREMKKFHLSKIKMIKLIVLKYCIEVEKQRLYPETCMKGGGD